MYSTVEVFLHSQSGRCFEIDLIVKGTSLWKLYKKITAWQVDVRSHVMEDLGDTPRFNDMQKYLIG